VILPIDHQSNVGFIFLFSLNGHELARLLDKVLKPDTRNRRTQGEHLF
jgi:hypothetical protein